MTTKLEGEGGDKALLVGPLKNTFCGFPFHFNGSHGETHVSIIFKHSFRRNKPGQLTEKPQHIGEGGGKLSKATPKGVKSVCVTRNRGETRQSASLGLTLHPPPKKNNLGVFYPNMIRVNTKENRYYFISTVNTLSCVLSSSSQFRTDPQRPPCPCRCSQLFFCTNGSK